ncbi:hypothetical protein SE91_26350 [Bradyrhizobium sp. DOA1]|nr:hypothetical protein SE91_26350 [Bradyrhizobium sp. DOA1]
MASLKIHAAKSNVAVREKKIAMVSFVSTCHCACDWLPCFSDVRMNFYSHDAAGAGANERFLGDYLDEIRMDVAHDHEQHRGNVCVDKLTHQIDILASDETAVHVSAVIDDMD